MDNRRQNVVIHDKLEKRLITGNQIEIHIDVFRKLIETGIVVELCNWKRIQGAN